MSYREVMDLPIKAFWFMNSTIVRLMAESDIRSLAVVSSAHASEGIRQARENLVVEMGDVVKIDPIAGAIRDQTGFDELRAMT